jgi:glycosyltransferase involved in cell wall biosynthesis
MPYPLRFAVNARPLRKPVTGISRYLRELMREVERDDRFAPHYFYSTHWGENLDRAPGQLLSPNLMRLGGLLRAVDPLLRSIERRNFAAGLRGGNFAFYFEPAYLPFRTTLPTVITVHDLSHLRHPETHPAARVRKFERELPAAIEQAAVILTPSEFTRGEVIEVFGVSPERVVATPLGADAAFFPRNRDETAAVLEPLALAHGRYFLAVGTLEPRKNIVTTLDAHSRLPQRVRTAYPLVVAGMSGWLNDAIARRLETARARGDVRLLGHVGEEQLPLLYAGAAMLAYPSLYEGFGLPPLEAMASGVPVAVSDRASLPEVVGDAGILVDPYDVEGLTAAMLRVVEDPRFAEDMAARGIERAKAFTWERCAKMTMQAWEDASGARSSSRGDSGPRGQAAKSM